jgi:hypothetical protein
VASDFVACASQAFELIVNDAVFTTWLPVPRVDLNYAQGITRLSA